MLSHEYYVPKFWIKFISYKKFCEISCEQIFQKYSDTWERIQFHYHNFPSYNEANHMTTISTWWFSNYGYFYEKYTLSILSSIVNCWQQSRINTGIFSFILLLCNININAQNGWYNILNLEAYKQRDLCSRFPECLKDVPAGICAKFWVSALNNFFEQKRKSRRQECH